MMNMRTNGHRRPEEIQAEIERTRSELDETLSAIEQRLTPGQLVDQGLDYLKHSGARQYVSNLGESAKQSPLPLALVGIGLAWLMMSERSRAHPSPIPRSRALVPYEPGSDTEMDADWSARGDLDDLDSGKPGAREKMADMAHSARDRASDMAHRASDAAHSARDRATGMAHSARERVSQLGSSASQAKGRVVQMAGTARERARMAVDSTRQRASHMADSARYQAERVRQGYDHVVQEQPLVIGAIGFAIGALLGAAAPRTRREDELMGATSDRLLDDAKEAVREPMQRAAEVARTAAGAATGAATEAWRSSSGGDGGSLHESDLASSSLDRDESTGGSAMGASKGVSDTPFMASGRGDVDAVSATEREKRDFQPAPLEAGPGVEPHRSSSSSSSGTGSSSTSSSTVSSSPSGSSSVSGSSSLASVPPSSTATGVTSTPPTYASGPEFESGSQQRRSPSGSGDSANDPPGGR